jgi:hypothetical protein
MSKAKNTTVKLGPHTYSVLEVDNLRSDEGAKLDGQIEYHKLKIEIDSDTVSTYKRYVLWHELIHGMLANAGIDGEMHDETTIDIIASGVMQVLQDNEWIRK